MRFFTYPYRKQRPKTQTLHHSHSATNHSQLSSISPKFSNPFRFFISQPPLISLFRRFFVFHIFEMENLNLALVSSPKPLLLGHSSSKNVFSGRKSFTFGTFRVSANSSSSHVTRAASKSHQNLKSGIFFNVMNMIFA